MNALYRLTQKLFNELSLSSTSCGHSIRNHTTDKVKTNNKNLFQIITLPHLFF